jgi:hypothetical protein
MVQALELATIDERLGLSFINAPKKVPMSILANPPPLEESVPTVPSGPTQRQRCWLDPWWSFRILEIPNPAQVPRGDQLVAECQYRISKLVIDPWCQILTLANRAFEWINHRSLAHFHFSDRITLVVWNS